MNVGVCPTPYVVLLAYGPLERSRIPGNVGGTYAVDEDMHTLFNSYVACIAAREIALI